MDPSPNSGGLTSRLTQKQAVFGGDKKDRNLPFRRPMNNATIYMRKCYG
jgi:hypothetical protein